VIGEINQVNITVFTATNYIHFYPNIVPETLLVVGEKTAYNNSSFLCCTPYNWKVPFQTIERFTD
jgi:hypothetical protein